MKKLITSILTATALTSFISCTKKESTALHWSHLDCITKIIADLNLQNYTYEAVQLEHQISNDDEIYSFKITVYSGKEQYTYYCYTVLDDNEVIFIDCDPWDSTEYGEK